MTLFINTSEFNNVQFTLISSDGILYEFKKDLAFNENYKTNELLQKFLSKHKVSMKDLVKIIVCSGPGSFTGIRVGVSLAQALGFGLDIPVIAIPKNKVPDNLLRLTTIKLPDKLTLHYGQKPNIGKIKKRT